MTNTNDVTDFDPRRSGEPNDIPKDGGVRVWASSGSLKAKGVGESPGSLSGRVERASVADTNTTTSGANIVPVDTNDGAVTVTLSDADTVDGREITVKDEGGNAGTNNVTVDTESSQTIDGSASTTISSDYGSVTVYSDGTDFFTR